METQNQDIVKAAAHTMCASLGSKGVKVSHSQMLEALADGLGLDNWRKLKAVIDAPRAKPTKTKAAKPKPALPPEGVEQEWLVDALYLDNSQPYGDRVTARTALEAAYSVTVERLTDYGLVVGIFSVSSADNKLVLAPHSVHQYELEGNWEALNQLRAACLALVLKEPDVRFIEASNWLADVLAAFPCENRQTDSLEFITDDDALRSCRGAEAEKLLAGGSMTPTEALCLLCKAVEDAAGGIVALESSDEALACVLHQITATCGYFDDVINTSAQGLALIDE